MGIGKEAADTACIMIQQIERNDVKLGETILHSMAEITINGIEFQVQLHFVSEKSQWIAADACAIATIMQTNKN